MRKNPLVLQIISIHQRKKMHYLLLIILILNNSFQCVVSIDFLKEYFFPRNPILHRVRKVHSARGFGNPGILDFVGLVESQGYPAEEHYLTTTDGYKLVIHRIPGSPINPPKIGKPVVLLQHGLFGSSDTWVLMGAQKDLAFILADEGYDVWVGNVRGNSYCRSHEVLSTLDADFWNFSYHEIGFYDLSAMIDYSLHKTGEKNIIYIGHSMGTTMNYVLLSTKPAYNQKIRLSVNLAPIALWEILPIDYIYKLIIEHSNYLTTFFDKNNIHDLFPQTDNSVRAAHDFCGANNIIQSICAAFLFSLAGSNPDQLNITTLPKILSYFPAGGSVRTVDHYAQNLRNGTFRQYDYGYTINYKIYGKKRPPLYDVKIITAPIALIYSGNDPLVRLKNVIELSKKLANVVEMHKVPDDEFNHLDYIWARDAKDLLYNKILDILATY